jgi:hypothetical protein
LSAIQLPGGGVGRGSGRRRGRSFSLSASPCARHRRRSEDTPSDVAVTLTGSAVRLPGPDIPAVHLLVFLWIHTILGLLRIFLSADLLPLLQC